MSKMFEPWLDEATGKIVFGSSSSEDEADQELRRLAEEERQEEAAAAACDAGEEAVAALRAERKAEDEAYLAVQFWGTNGTGYVTPWHRSGADVHQGNYSDYSQHE